MRFLLYITTVHFICGYGDAIRKFYMEDYCSKELNMIVSSFYQAAISLNTNNFFSYKFWEDSNSNECKLTVKAWYTYDYIGFYFDSLNLPCDDGYLVFYDDDRIMNGLDKVCNDYPHDGQYVATSRSLKIKYVGVSSKRLHSREVMKLIVTSFHEGVCASYAYKCDSGRCINDDIVCNGYNSCGDGDNCRLSSGALAGIIVGSLAGATAIVIIVVMVYCCRRKRNLPTTMAAPGGQVVYMAQAIPTVSMNTTQQPPPYSTTVGQPLQAGYYGNQGLQYPQQKQMTVSNPTP